MNGGNGTTPSGDASRSLFADRDREVLEVARKALVGAAEWNEGEPCWCPLWWWDEQTGPSEGAHMSECDKQRELLACVMDGLA